VHIGVRNEPLETADLKGARYDLVIMNGCLHYVRDKEPVLRRVLAASAADAVHAVALFSTATPVPAEYAVVPVFPDEEGGVVERFYQGWDMLLFAHERHRSEHSHPGLAPHVHSHIKLIAARAPARQKGSDAPDRRHAPRPMPVGLPMSWRPGDAAVATLEVAAWCRPQVQDHGGHLSVLL